MFSMPVWFTKRGWQNISEEKKNEYRHVHVEGVCIRNGGQALCESGEAKPINQIQPVSP